VVRMTRVVVILTVMCLIVYCSNQLALGGGSGGNTNSSGSNAVAKDARTSTDDDSDDDYDEDETATRELSSWRAAVGSASSSAQLSLYLTQLHRCVAWEKSIMKVVSIVNCALCQLFYAVNAVAVNARHGQVLSRSEQFVG
jgi:hypothetical protein